MRIICACVVTARPQKNCGTQFFDFSILYCQIGCWEVHLGQQHPVGCSAAATPSERRRQVIRASFPIQTTSCWRHSCCSSFHCVASPPCCGCRYVRPLALDGALFLKEHLLSLSCGLSSTAAIVTPSVFTPSCEFPTTILCPCKQPRISFHIKRHQVPRRWFVAPQALPESVVHRQCSLFQPRRSRWSVGNRTVSVGSFRDARVAKLAHGACHWRSVCSPLFSGRANLVMLARSRSSCFTSSLTCAADMNPFRLS